MENGIIAHYADIIHKAAQARYHNLKIGDKSKSLPEIVRDEIRNRHISEDIASAVFREVMKKFSYDSHHRPHPQHRECSTASTVVIHTPRPVVIKDNTTERAVGIHQALLPNLTLPSQFRGIPEGCYNTRRYRHPV